MMTIYLHDIPLLEAWSRLETALREVGHWGVLGIEEIPLSEAAVGRVLAAPVWAKISSPHYNAAAMDGFGVRSKDTFGANLTEPVTLNCNKIENRGAAIYLDTGDPLPAWVDAVIPIEEVEAFDQQGIPAVNPRQSDHIQIRASVTPWSNVRPMGEDIVASQLVLPAGHTLRPVDLGAIAASGEDKVQVARRPRVAILPTGTELVPPGTPAKAGEIIEFNSLVLAAQVNSWGGLADRFPIIPDDYAKIRDKVLEAIAEYDLILLNAGSSAGSEDFSAQVIAELGDLLVHGVAIRPGHPVILGMVGKHDQQTRSQMEGQKGLIPIIGVPGYPVSAALTGEIFVEPLLARWSGRQPTQPPEVTATLTRKVTSPAGDDDYLRVAVGRVGQKLLAAPLARGSGVITSLTRADGLLIIPRGSQGMPAGAQAQVRLYCSPADLERTIFAIGSHDITLDLLAQFLARHNRRLASANVGSLGGLVALRRGEAHLAGSHLLDAESGEYNLRFIREHLTGVPVKVVALVNRQQGLIVTKGNPKTIHSLQDLSRDDIVFVNRQRGSGTRVLLDYHLDLLGIAPEMIPGYNQEEYTHLAVAAAVASGRADCGLGIAAAAEALHVDFIPLFEEPYELVIPAEHFHSPLLEPLLELLKDAEFRQAVERLPGYDSSCMGTLVAEVS